REDMCGMRFFDPPTLGMRAILEHAEMIEVLPRRNIAQSISRTGHPAGLGVERAKAADERVAQASLEQHCGQRCGRDPEQLVVRFFRKVLRCHRPSAVNPCACACQRRYCRSHPILTSLCDMP